MDLFEIAKDQPMKVKPLPDSEWRLVDQIIKHPQGLVFVDVGWINPEYPIGDHGLHLLQGKITELEEEFTWKIGQAVIEFVSEEDPLMVTWKDWLNIKPDNATRERAEEFAEATFS